MDIRKIISKFLTQVCEKNYSEANKTLNVIVEEKTKNAIKKVASVKVKKTNKPHNPNMAYRIDPDGTKTKIPLNDDGSIKRKKVVKENEEKPKFRSTVKSDKPAPTTPYKKKGKYSSSSRDVDKTEEWRKKKDLLKKSR
jgi:hypothetical protein